MTHADDTAAAKRAFLAKLKRERKAVGKPVANPVQRARHQALVLSPKQAVKLAAPNPTPQSLESNPRDYLVTPDAAKLRAARNKVEDLKIAKELGI